VHKNQFIFHKSVTFSTRLFKVFIQKVNKQKKPISCVATREEHIQPITVS